MVLVVRHRLFNVHKVMKFQGKRELGPCRYDLHERKLPRCGNIRHTWRTTFQGPLLLCPCASPAFHRYTLVGRAVDHWDRCTGARNGNARPPLRRDAYQSTRRARVPTLMLCQHMHSHWTTSQRISPASSTSLTSRCPSILGGNPTFPHDSRAILRVVSMPPECACRLARR